MWYIHDYPTYGLASGQVTKGYKSCPQCNPNITTLVGKPVRCAQFLCDGCPLRLGGDLGATARAFLTMQNDVYTTGVMMQS
jgi:hypothetical protein